MFQRFGPILLAAPCSKVWQAVHLRATFWPSAMSAAASSGRTEAGPLSAAAISAPASSSSAVATT